jgi:excisionase family DNA binding protein
MSTATARTNKILYPLVPAQDSASERVVGIDTQRIGKVMQQADAEAAQSNRDERLLNAREVAEKLGVSERFIRDHTTRRSPKIPAVRLGKLIRYRRTDVDDFMAEMDTLSSSRRSRLGV